MGLHLLEVCAAAIGAACCYAISDVVEQRKAAAAPPETSMRVSLLWHLAKQPTWWLAIAVDIGGFVLATVALGLGEVVFVQPMLLVGLPIALVLAGRVGGRIPTRRDLGWALVFVASLTLFLVVGDPTGNLSRRSLSAWLAPFVIVAVLTLGCVLLSRRLNAAFHSLALGLAAGMLFGISSTLMKSFAGLVADDGWALLGHWEPYVMAGVVSLGFLIMQSAYQAGDLQTALPAIDLAEPVVASVLGLVLFKEQFRATGLLGTIVLIASVVVMVVSTVRLARSAARGGTHVEPVTAIVAEPRSPM